MFNLQLRECDKYIRQLDTRPIYLGDEGKLTKRKHVVLAMQAMHSEPMASIAGIARTLTH